MIENKIIYRGHLCIDKAAKNNVLGPMSLCISLNAINQVLSLTIVYGSKILDINTGFLSKTVEYSFFLFQNRSRTVECLVSCSITN
jgi:hypothetical protein